MSKDRLLLPDLAEIPDIPESEKHRGHSRILLELIAQDRGWEDENGAPDLDRVLRELVGEAT